MHPAGAKTMSWEDFGGAAAGGAGGLVRWHQDPTRNESISRKISAAVTSVVCGSGFGYLTQSLIEWRLPDVPHAVAVGLAFLAGLTSGILAQMAVTLVSEAIMRLKVRLLDKYLPAPPNATGQPPTGQQPAPGQSFGGVANPAHHGAVGGGGAGVQLPAGREEGGARPAN